MIALSLLAVVLTGTAFALRTERGRRWHCRKRGHDARVHRAEPVIPLYFICKRCGRYSRTLAELRSMR